MMTAAGRDKNAAMWPVYARIIREEFATRLSTEEAYHIVRYLIRLYP